jgi:cyanate permease
VLVARRLRAALLAAVVALYVVSIPWYRAAGAETSVWLGLPDWVAVALLCYAAVAVLNSLAWLLTDVPDRDGRDESERR